MALKVGILAGDKTLIIKAAEYLDDTVVCSIIIEYPIDVLSPLLCNSVKAKKYSFIEIFLQ